MEKIVFFLVSLACVCSTKQERELATDGVDSVESLHALARTLFAFNPVVAAASDTRLWPNGAGDDSTNHAILPARSVRDARFDAHTISMSGDDQNDKPVKKGFKLGPALAGASYAGAPVCAGFELLEDAHELNLHSGHGMLFLASSKLCGEISELFASSAELEEVAPNRLQRIFKVITKPFAFVLRIFTSKTVSLALALFSLAAALNEVFEDLMPGGHHGVALLAISEVLELLDTTHLLRGRLKKLVEGGVLKLALAIGAAVGATIETLGSLHLRKIGTHHGVLLLAVGKILKLVGTLRASVEEGREGLEIVQS